MISGFSKLIHDESKHSWMPINFTKSEPEIIEEYLLSNGKGVDYLNQNISKVISSQTQYELKFASVYCHQKPRVTRTQRSKDKCNGDTPSCELGDLMTIFILLDRNKSVIHSTAKIMQAKKKDFLDSESQKCLYESDLEFEMPKNIVAKSTNNSSLRKLPNYHESRNMGLSYLILNDKDPYNKEIPRMSNLNYSWGAFIQLMMEFKTGLAFKLPQNSNEIGWDCIINDLLNIGTRKVYSSIKRGSGLEYFLNAFNNFSYFPEYKLEFKESGIPMLVIICKDTEREI